MQGSVLAGPGPVGLPETVTGAYLKGTSPRDSRHAEGVADLGSDPQTSQRAQYGLIKEYTLNHIVHP